MVEVLKEQMQKKGWSDDELAHLENVLTASKKRDYLMKKHLDSFFYWNTVFIICLLNFIAILVLTPFLLFFDDIWVYGFSSFIGLAFGMMVNHLTHASGRLKHHMIAVFLIPALCVVDFVAFSRYFDFLQKAFKVDVSFNGIILSAFFVSCFALPYVLAIIFKKRG